MPAKPPIDTMLDGECNKKKNIFINEDKQTNKTFSHIVFLLKSLNNVHLREVFFMNNYVYLQSRKTQQAGNSDETDSVKPRSSIQGENSIHRSRNTRDALNKFEGKENAKDTTNKPATVSNQCIISLLSINMLPNKGR